jgi:hypothetical protein
MNKLRRLGALAGVATASSAILAAFAGGAGATVRPSDQGHFFGPRQAVFVQSDDPTGNTIVTYDRGPGGTLSYAGTTPTSGLGGVLTGSVVDHLASQGSLAYDAEDSLLLAVNAGSNTVSVFSVLGDQLTLRQVVSSGGSFPVSVAIHDNLAYVLNAESGGAVQGYFIGHGGLTLIPAWNRALGLGTTSTSAFTSTPGQVAFSPNGSQLIVTTKNSTNSIDVFNLGPFGTPAANPVVNSLPADVPFAVAFNAAGQLLVTEAGPSAVDSFWLYPNGTLAPVTTLLTGQAATCWIAGPADGSLFFASNAGSASLTGLRSFGGPIVSTSQTSTDPGTVDAAVSSDGQYLYTQTGGNGIVDEFHINFDGSLSEIGSVIVPDAQGGEGIVAS